MFERFTEKARKAVVLAQEEARRFNHNYIGTEHLLLGLLREREGAGSRALDRLNVDLDRTREQIESIVGLGEEPTGGEAPFTPRSKEVLELARRESLRLGRARVGTEHLLLALAFFGEGVAVRVLEAQGIPTERVRSEVMGMIGEGQSDGITAEELREVVDGLNQTMGRNFLKSALYALLSTLVLFPVVVFGAYVGFRLALKKTLREGVPRTIRRCLGL